MTTTPILEVFRVCPDPDTNELHFVFEPVLDECLDRADKVKILDDAAALLSQAARAMEEERTDDGE